MADADKPLIVRFEGDSKGIEKAANRSKKAVKSYATMTEARMRDAKGRFMSAQTQMRLALSKTDKTLERFAIRLKFLGPQIDKVGVRMQRLGRTLTFRVAAPIIAFGVASAIAFGSFDKAMTESLSIMETTAEQAERMKNVALELRSIKGPTELAKSYFFLASAGLDAEKSMKALPIIARFATAGAFDMAQATDLLTDAQTALGMVMDDNQKNMELLGDHIVLANKQANASVQQFAESLTSDAGVAARNFGAEIETTLAVLGAYASAGKKGAESGNLFGRATRLLSKAFRSNGKVFQKYGIDIIDDATGQYANFIQIIKQMEEAFKGLTAPEIGQALEDLGFEALAQKSILPLLGMSEAMEKWEAEQKRAAGTTKDVFNKQMDALANKMKVVWNQIKIVSIGIGEQLVPAIEAMGNAVEGATKSWGKFSSITKSTISVLATAIVTVSVLTWGLGALARAAMFAATGFTSLASSKLVTKLLATGFGVKLASSVGVLTKLLTGLGLYGVGAGAAGAGFILFLAAMHRDVSKLNEALKKSIELTNKMAGQGLANILNNTTTTTDEKGSQVSSMGDRLKKDMEYSKRMLDAVKKHKKETKGLTGFVGAIGGLAGFDPFGLEVARQQFEAAAQRWREFSVASRSALKGLKDEISALEIDNIAAEANKKVNELLKKTSLRRSQIFPSSEDVQKQAQQLFIDINKATKMQERFGVGTESKVFGFGRRLAELSIEKKVDPKNVKELTRQLQIYKQMVGPIGAIKEEEKERLKNEERVRKLLEATSPFDKMKSRVKEVNDLWAEGYFNVQEVEKVVAKITKDYERATKDKQVNIHYNVSGLTALRWGSTEHAAQFQKYMAGRGKIVREGKTKPTPAQEKIPGRELPIQKNQLKTLGDILSALNDQTGVIKEAEKDKHPILVKAAEFEAIGGTE